MAYVIFALAILMVGVAVLLTVITYWRSRYDEDVSIDLDFLDTPPPLRDTDHDAS